MVWTVTPNPHIPYKDRICNVCKQAKPVLFRQGMLYYCADHYEQRKKVADDTDP